MSVQFDEAVEAFRGGDLDRARSLAQAELSSVPSPSAHHLLGLISCRLGDPAAGVEHLRIAADAQPDNAGFRIMLMRALVDAGRAADVLQMPEPPRIRSAGALEQWRARGEAADSAKDYAAAVAAWSTVTAAAAPDWRAWANLGSALAAQSQLAEAIEAFRNAIRVNSTEASIYSMLSATLAAADRHEEVFAALDEWERIEGPNEGAAIARGRSLLALTRFTEAEEAYRDALRHSPASPDAFRELGLLFERTSRLELLSELLANAEAAGVPSEQLTYLYAVRAFREGRTDEAYALMSSFEPDDELVRWQRLKWKIADRLQKPAEAFAAAEMMNSLTPDYEGWRRRAADYRTRLRDLAAGLTSASALPQLPELEGRPPAFLVGFPRSGTTLLDTFLMGHRDTAVLEEVHLLGDAEIQIGKIADLPSASKSALNRARTAYLAGLERHVDKAFSGLVIDKLPMNLVAAHFIQSLFPGAPIIFAQRHPCDAVLSGFMQSFVMNDAMASFLTIEDSADLYDAVLCCWETICNISSLNLHVVRYERLVDDPETELRPLVDFLGLPWDERMLAHTETARQRGTVITASYDQVTEPLSTNPVRRWERYREQLDPVLPVLLPWAERLGYND